MKLLKILFFLIILIITPIIQAQNGKQQMKYDTLLTVVNNTGEAGYFGVCAQPLHPGGDSLCSIPEKIETGPNRIFMPHFENPYPVFTSMSEEPYTCGTEDNPTQQLFLPITKDSTHTILLGPYLKDKDNNDVAVLCVLYKQQ